MKKLISRALVPVVGALAAITMAAPHATAASFAPCDGGDTQFCYDETGTTPVGYTVPNLAWGETIDVTDVAAYLDIYSVSVGTGSVSFPCVTVVENGVERDVCKTLGFTRVNRIPLVDQPVRADLVKVDGTLVRVYVCTGEVTATVASIGVTRMPVLSVCADNPETLYNMIPNGW